MIYKIDPNTIRRVVEQLKFFEEFSRASTAPTTQLRDLIDMARVIIERDCAYTSAQTKTLAAKIAAEKAAHEMNLTLDHYSF